MSEPLRPTLRRRRLGNELRRIREERGLTLQQAARLLHRSHSSMSKIETGKRGIFRPSLENMLDRYGIDDPAQRETLFRLAAEARADTKGWWQSYDHTVSPEMLEFLSLEADSTKIDFFELILIPGLLQTEAYARALIRKGPFGHDPERVERLVKIRTKRRELLHKARPPLLLALVDEAALHRQVGGCKVMEGQLRHLISLSDLPHVALRVLPFSEGAHPGMTSAFKIMQVGDRVRLEVVVVDSQTGITYHEEERDIKAYSEIFGQLESSALSREDSRALIERLASTYGRSG